MTNRSVRSAQQDEVLTLWILFTVTVTLRDTVGRSWCRAPPGAHDQIVVQLVSGTAPRSLWRLGRPGGRSPGLGRGCMWRDGPGRGTARDGDCDGKYRSGANDRLWSKSTFLPNTPRFPKKKHCFPKVPRLRPVVLLVRTRRWRWVWSIDGMILTGKNRSLGESPVPVPLCPLQISHRLLRDRIWASAVKGRRLWRLNYTIVHIMFSSDITENT